MADYLFFDRDLFLREPTDNGAQYRQVPCDVVVPPQPPMQPMLWWLAALCLALSVAARLFLPV